MYAPIDGDFLSKNVKSLGLTTNTKEYPDNKKLWFKAVLQCC